jgi:pyrroline-5-carboxylate reductase
VSELSIGFVGGGRVVRIMLAGWTRARRPPAKVVVSDPDAAMLDRLKAEFPFVITTADNRLAAGQDLVLFALHPPAFAAALGEIKGHLAAGGIFVSLAPKWTMAGIGGALGGFSRLARVIPNAPSIVNAGYNPVSFSASLTADDRARLRALFEPLGAFPEVPEDTLEAYAIVAAMGPTYFWYQCYQLVDLGCEFGLTKEAAAAAVVAMLGGAALTMAEAGLAPEGVMDLIPVKPLAPIEPTVREAYVNTLGALHKKLKS